MSEQKMQSKYVPLRVRFRSAPGMAEREQPKQGNVVTEDVLQGQSVQLPVPPLLALSESQQHAQQIKELLRLGNLLRADLGLSEVLQRIVASMSTCTGFRVLIVNLIEEGNSYVLPVAFSGISAEDEHLICENPVTIEQMHRLMRPEFRVSQSYFISHEQKDVFAGITVIASRTMTDHVEGQWHPEDMLLTPLVSPREQKLLGFLSLDDPENDRIPTLETIEMVELFANQAATAIDNARIFQEREGERIALDKGIALLREDMEQIQRGDLRTRVRSNHQKLQPIGDAVNNMMKEFSNILGSMQMVTRAVDEHTRNVQYNSELLVRDTGQQEQQVNRISQVIDNIATMMHQVSDGASTLSKMATEAMDITLEGQGAVDRAVEGMGKVREATMQSARTMKRLGESGQEINETMLVVTDLTTRMHLLALNAAIEAARAGEHGQGFAVVAQEIRTLAMSSAEASRKVGGYVRSIQNETGAVSQSVEQNTQQVVMQTELVTQTGITLDAISVVTEQMANLVQGICSMADNQAQGSRLVVHAVGEILRVTGEINVHMHEMRQSMSHLLELADSLRSRMSVFQM